MIRDEFVFGVQEKKLHPFMDLYRYTEIFREESDHLEKEIRAENIRFWNDVQEGWILVFQRTPKKGEGALTLLGKMPVDDAIKKFG